MKSENEHVWRLHATEEMLIFNKIHVIRASQLVVKKLYLTSRLLNEKLPLPVKGLPICNSLWMLQETHVFVSFGHSIPLLGLILASSEKQALFWRFHSELLIFRWDIYVFISFSCSIQPLGLILTSSEKWALFWRLHAELLIFHWDI